MREELDIKVSPDAMHPLAFASAPVAGKHLLLLLYAIEQWHGEPKAIEAPEIGWFSFEDIATLSMPPADAPLLPALGHYLAHRKQL